VSSSEQFRPLQALFRADQITNQQGRLFTPVPLKSSAGSLKIGFPEPKTDFWASQNHEQPTVTLLQIMAKDNAALATSRLLYT
jgi:hypothetical protein